MVAADPHCLVLNQFKQYCRGCMFKDSRILLVLLANLLKISNSVVVFIIFFVNCVFCMFMALPCL